MDTAAPFAVRTGSADDAPVLVALFDDAVRWLTERGSTGQWGTEPFSTNPDRVAACRRWAAGGGLRFAERAGEVAGALVVGAAPAYVPPSDEPELYVVALVAARSPIARGAGRFLLAVAEAEARAAGAARVRVDCYAGGDGALVRVYESAGFRRTATFSVGSWPGQILERRLLPAPPAG